MKIMMVATLACLLYFVPQQKKEESQISDVIKAKNFYVVNGEGKTIATLGESRDGQPELYFFSPSHKGGMSIVTEPNGGTRMAVLDSTGEVRLSASVGEDRLPGFVIYNSKGPAAMLTTLPNGRPILMDRDGNPLR